MTMNFGKTIKDAFARLLGTSEPPAPAAPAMTSVDRKDLTLCVIDEFDTKKRSNEFIAGRWAEIASALEEGFSVARPMNDLETELVGAVRTVEHAIRSAGTFDARITVPQATVETLVQKGALAYNAKNVLMARVGELPVALDRVEPPVLDASQETLRFKFPKNEDQERLLQRHDRLAMFALKSREALSRYSADAPSGPRPDAEA